MSALTLREILAFDVLGEAAPEVLTGADRLDRPVRWVHSSEIYEIGPLLSGGELLLTTGLGLAGADAGARRHYIRELAERAVTAVAIEVGRSLPEVPFELIDESRRRDLPLVVLRRVVPFIRIAEAANTAIVALTLAEQPRDLDRSDHTRVNESRSSALLSDLIEGRALGQSEVTARGRALGFQPDQSHRLLGVAAQGPDPEAVRAVLDLAARQTGAQLLRATLPGTVLGLLALPGTNPGGGSGGSSSSGGATGAGDPVRATQQAIRSAAEHHPGAAGLTVALGYAVPARAAWTRWGESLREARAALRLALSVPLPELSQSSHSLSAHSPAPARARLPLVISSRAVALERELVGDGLTAATRDRLAQLVTRTLGPLLEWEATHPSDLVHTLEVHLRNGCSPTRTAALLHLGRQSLYQRIERIESLLGQCVADPELHAELLLATCARRVLQAVG